MKLLEWVLIFSISQSLLANPKESAIEHIGKKMIDTYFNNSFTDVLKKVEILPENKRKTFGKSILLNLHGHNFDTTLMHNGKEVVSISRVFYDENSAPDFFNEIEKTGKSKMKLVKIKSGAKPGTFYDYDFKSEGVFFRFNQNKKIQIITLTKSAKK